MSAPSSTYISMRATASSMPAVGRQSVRAMTRMPQSFAASTAARIFMRASSRGRQGLPPDVSARGVILSSMRMAAAPSAAVGANGALDVHRVAVAVVAVGEDEQVGRGGAHHVEGVEHLRERDDVEVGTAEAAGCDARAGHERGLEAGGERELGAQVHPRPRA